MHPLVSVIIPAYNVAVYLDECLKSVISQTYMNLEVLLMDDGSTDHTPSICDAWAEKDRRVIVVHKPNTGVSDTRNQALRLAKGAYILFLDADDYWLREDVVERMVEIAQRENVDLVRGGYTEVNVKGEFLRDSQSLKRRSEYANQVLNAADFLQSVIINEFFSVLTLFSRKALEGVFFDTNVIFMEDTRFYGEVLRKECSCYYEPALKFYAYRKSGTGISSRTDSRKLRDSFSLSTFYRELSARTSDKRLRAAFLQRSLSAYLYALESISWERRPADYRTTIEEYDLNHLHQEMKQLKRNLNPYRISFCFWMTPYMYLKFLRLKPRFVLQLIDRFIR